MSMSVFSTDNYESFSDNKSLNETKNTELEDMEILLSNNNNNLINNGPLGSVTLNENNTKDQIQEDEWKLNKQTNKQTN
ncbi:hypothetical protein BCR32DRAFT_285638 [Anaeromyces robustus]|uniref:Uncharacterized protein n=1 Tax=Anaeromyces robustus TaxID=1754192 RepID=A0A1Y1WIY2_9FUNG|nr:hypothetical protein BCR32DRAFT_285638 [Anaeromyces robustus]|eukprot:ORX73442.1 hypothetical protein BCR32DRAFT_285638 [Anaeromyces robustus]